MNHVLDKEFCITQNQRLFKKAITLSDMWVRAVKTYRIYDVMTVSL